MSVSAALAGWPILSRTPRSDQLYFPIKSPDDRGQTERPLFYLEKIKSGKRPVSPSFLSRKPLSGSRAEFSAQCLSVGAGVPSDQVSTGIMNSVIGSGAP